jgi:hypothetical protein
LNEDLQDNLANRLNSNPPFSGRLTLEGQPLLSNVLNHANFDTPNLIVFSGTDVSPTAGVITGTGASGNGRQIQFALRLEF